MKSNRLQSDRNEKERRIYDVVLHFRLQDGIVRVERGDSSAELVRELLEAVIDTSDIILARKCSAVSKIKRSGYGLMKLCNK